MTLWIEKKRRFALTAGWAILASATTAFAQATPRTLVSPAMVLQAMQQRQLPVAGVTVRLAAPVTASVAEPQLAIQSFVPTDAHHAQLLVECRVHTECLPFYVTAVWPTEINLVSQHIGLGVTATDQQHAAPSNSPNPNQTGDVLKPGTPATLLIDDNKLHITLRVVSLQAGVPGDKIRVVTTDRRQVFVAELLGNGILKGSLSHE
jgi:hypothetical protein